MINTHTTTMTYEQAQRFAPSPREILTHLCEQGARDIYSPEELHEAAEDIRQIAVMQVCTGIDHSELDMITEIATELHFNAQSRTKWAHALDALRGRFVALMTSLNYAA